MYAPTRRRSPRPRGEAAAGRRQRRRPRGSRSDGCGGGGRPRRHAAGAAAARARRARRWRRWWPPRGGGQAAHEGGGVGGGRVRSAERCVRRRPGAAGAAGNSGAVAVAASPAWTRTIRPRGCSRPRPRTGYSPRRRQRLLLSSLAPNDGVILRPWEPSQSSWWARDEYSAQCSGWVPVLRVSLPSWSPRRF